MNMRTTEGGGRAVVPENAPTREIYTSDRLIDYFIEGEKYDLLFGFQTYPGFIALLGEEAKLNDGLLPYDPGFVYAIWAKGTTWFKFGKSKNTDRRYKQISPKLMHETILLKTWAVPFMSKAEKLLHNIYATNRANGEWFSLSNSEALKAFRYCEDSDPLLDLLQCAYWLEILDKYSAMHPKEHLTFSEEVLKGTYVVEPEINSWLQKIFSRIANRRTVDRDFSAFILSGIGSNSKREGGAA